jgi:hypothetical protein
MVRWGEILKIYHFKKYKMYYNKKNPRVLFCRILILQKTPTPTVLEASTCHQLILGASGSLFKFVIVDESSSYICQRIDESVMIARSISDKYTTQFIIFWII